MSKHVLLIVTSHAQLGDTGRQTGLYLSEFAHPYEVFSRAGFEISVASPQGGDAPVDPKSLSDELQPYMQYTRNTLSLNQIRPEKFAAFFVVGGHGTMWDLPGNAELQRMLPLALSQGKAVAAVCHGPAALVQLKNPDGSSLIQGKRVAGFSNDEERAAQLSQVMPFLLEDELKRAGGLYQQAPVWQANVARDGQLVTGQNPASAKGVAEAVVELVGRG
jgi:putative intracellular protease/amidase